MRGNVLLQAVVQIYKWWYLGVVSRGWHIGAKGEWEGLSAKLWTHLKACAAAATPMSVPSSSFGRRQRAASFLSSYWVEIFRVKWELQGNLDQSWIITSNTSTKSIFRFPSWVECEKFEFNFKRRKEHLEKSWRIFCASFNCEGGVIFLRRLLRQKLLERKKSLPRLFLFRCLHLFITSIHNLLHFVFFMEFCVPSFRVRWPYQTFTRVRVRDGDKMGFFATRIVD